jgi:hypothetical protein
METGFKKLVMNHLAYATVHVIGDSILLTKGWFEKVGKN